MDYVLPAVAIFVLCLGSYFFVRHRKLRKLNAEWEERHPRSSFQYCGKTLLFYDVSHGNQVEFLDPNGRCYLWYPGNPIILVGRWRCDESSIYFQYGFNTYNPVTGVVGGRWESCPIDFWSTSIVEDVAGDILKLKKRIPFVLKPHPRIGSLQQLRSSGRK